MLFVVLKKNELILEKSKSKFSWKKQNVTGCCNASRMIQKLRGIKFFSKDTKIKMLSTPLNYTFDVFVNEMAGCIFIKKTLK
jgi:hypothetical protein